MLTIPPPTAEFEPLAPGVAPLEKPLTVAIGPVVRDGTPLTIADVAVSGLHAFRRRVAGAGLDVWRSDLKAWVADPSPGLAEVPVEPLAFLAAEPSPWQGIVVPAGATDASGAPRYAPATAGYPAYSFRARFETPDGQAQVSAATAPVSFGSLADRNLMVMGPGDGEKPETATLARLELKSPALATIGGLVIRRSWPGGEITLGNASGASVVIAPDGGITLRPAPGRSVVVAGDLETDRIVYLPAGGGPKKTLG